MKEMTRGFKIKLLLWNFAIKMSETLFFGFRYWWWKLNFLQGRYYSHIDPGGIIESEREKAKGFNLDNFIYGDTPPITAKLILEKIDPEPRKIIYDLGCGRGNFLFTANILFKLRGVGVELFSPYIINCKRITRDLRLSGLDFRQENFLETNLRNADIVFIAGTTFEKKVRDALAKNLRKLKKDSIVINVHHKLPEKHFELFDQGMFPFTWGTDSVFFYRRR